MADLVKASRLDYLELLSSERAELIRLLAQLDAEEWAAPTECPAWSVKGIALHLLGDDLSILSRQRDGEPSTVQIEAGSDWDALFIALDRHNEQWVTASSWFSIPLLLDLLRLIGAESHRWYEIVDPDRFGEPIPWIGQEPAPYWLLCAREYLERWIHHSQIRRAVGRGEWFDELWVHPAVAVAVRGFPLGLASLPAPDGTTVALQIGDGPSWTLQKEELGWCLYDGTPTEPTVFTKLDTPTAALLFSRGLDKQEILESLKLSGDDELGGSFAVGLSAFFGR